MNRAAREHVRRMRQSIDAGKAEIDRQNAAVEENREYLRREGPEQARS